MICPKCGTSQPDGRQECSKCGVVFARMQLKAQRPRTPPSTPVPSEREPQRMPVPILAVAALLIILAGLIWTKHHRDAKARQPTSDDILNQINNEQIAKARERQARAIADAEKQRGPAEPQPDEQRMRSMIEQCPWFNEHVLATLPKSFSAAVYQWTMEKDPTLAIAVKEHIVELERGPTILVRLTTPALLASESDDLYHLDLGRRHLGNVTVVQDVPDQYVRVDITWTFEHPGGAALAPEGRERIGGADFQHRQGRWNLQSVWRTKGGGRELVCH